MDACRNDAYLVHSPISRFRRLSSSQPHTNSEGPIRQPDALPDLWRGDGLQSGRDPELRLKEGALELTLFSLPSEPPRIARMASANLPARQWRYGSLWRPGPTSGNSSSRVARAFADRIIVEALTEFEKIYLRTRMSVSISHISGPTPLTSFPVPPRA